MEKYGEQYQFNESWDIWYHHTLNDWNISGYRKIYTISNIKNFWSFYNNIDCIGGINNLNFYMMRQNITPIWEDSKNRNGGSWSLLVPVEKSYDMWEKIAIHLVGETLLQDTSQITGISIDQKNNVSVIKIWNNDRTKKDVSLLPSFIKGNGNIIYKNHKLDY
jgi:hypothetical protein